MKKRVIEIAVKVIVAALTAFLTAITTTSCMGYGPFFKTEILSLNEGIFIVKNITTLQYYITNPGLHGGCPVRC